MPGVDTALMVTQLIDMVVQGIAPALRRKAKAALLSKKREILTKITKSRYLLDKLETWYSRKNQADADLIFKSAGFGGVFDKYYKEAISHQKEYDKNRDILNMFEAKQQGSLANINRGMDRIEYSSPFAANKIANETLANEEASKVKASE